MARLVTDQDIDNATIIIENRKLKAVIPRDAIPPAFNITNFKLEGQELVLETTTGEKRVSLAGLLPNVVADRFLSAVTYDNKSKELVFTISQEGATDHMIRVPVSHFVSERVSAEEGNLAVLKDDGIFVPNKVIKEPCVELDVGMRNIVMTPDGEIRCLAPAYSRNIVSRATELAVSKRLGLGMDDDGTCYNVRMGFALSGSANVLSMGDSVAHFTIEGGAFVREQMRLGAEFSEVSDTTATSASPLVVGQEYNGQLSFIEYPLLVDATGPFTISFSIDTKGRKATGRLQGKVVGRIMSVDDPLEELSITD